MRDPTNVLPLQLPDAGDDYLPEILGFTSLALALGGMASQNRMLAWAGLVLGLVAVANQRNSSKQGSMRSASQGVTFSVTSIGLNIVQKLMLFAAEREHKDL